MLIFKSKSQKIAEAVKKFPQNIEATRNMLQKSQYKEDLTDIKLQLDTLEKNYLRLTERYKFDPQKIAQILFDSVQYDDILKDLIIDTESVAKHGYPTQEYANEKNIENQNILLKIEEVNLRFSKLLGDEYVDPRKFTK